MKSTAIAFGLVLAFLLATSAVSIGSQSNTNTVASQVAAAKAAAEDSWLILYSELCGVALGAGGRAASAPPPIGGAPAAGRQGGPPPREVWYRDPIKVFDNMWIFPTNDTAAWAIQTSEGIIMLDATFDYMVRDLIVANMPKLGLDPKQIKYVVVTHAHGDHYAGAKYLQDTFGARVLMSEADWSAIAQPATTGGFAGMPVPKKDMVVTDGQTLTLGDTTIRMYITPGHTLGTLSFIVPAKDKGATRMAAYWGGTAISSTTPYDNLVAYSSSARRFADIASKANAEVLLSNHPRYFDMERRAGANRANPAGPNAFIVNPSRVTNYLRVADHCAQAVALGVATKK
jgi:metallo-beta-lactamase class B